MLEHITKIIINASKIEVLPHFNKVERDYKSDGSVVTKADLAMQHHIESELSKAYPDIAFLGEEMSAEQQASLLASGQALWCLDPIDGTSNFAAGIPYFSVSLALIEDGITTLAIVYDPVRDECFAAQRGQGASLNGQQLSSQNTGLALKQTIALIDFKRLSNDLASQLITNRPYASQRSLGSIALELCWLAAGRGHIYLHGKQQLWDYAAAQLILSEAGGFSCTLEGEPISTQFLPAVSTIAALDYELFVQWCDYLKVTVN
ncbi:MAG: inositol monophosphatase [Gammaproteobacteria bacterium]|nr:MAG: inositol monophosphatase [Gammaproteobacteria bacterium]